jgi:acyl-CoA thioesterase-1
MASTRRPGDALLGYVAFGDSYTIGTAVSVPDRFPDRLALAVPRLELVANLGVNGYTSADVIRDALPAFDALEAGIVTLLVGVNDVVQGVPAPIYEANVRTILEWIRRRLPGDRIVTIAVPDYTVTPHGADYGVPRLQHDAIVGNNAIMARISGDLGIAFVDIFDLSLRAATDRSLVADDGLHPSGAQYALWVERIAPVVEGLLGS